MRRKPATLREVILHIIILITDPTIRNPAAELPEAQLCLQHALLWRHA